MVWVQIKERFHGKTYKIWKKYKSVAHARREHREWNSVANNPRWEHLSILKVSKTKGGKAIRRKKKRSSSFGLGFKKPSGWFNW